MAAAGDGCEDPAIAADDTYTHGHHESVLRSHRWQPWPRWRAWAADGSATFTVVHGELIAVV